MTQANQPENIFGRIVDARRYEPPQLDLSDTNNSRTMMIELTGTGKTVLEIGTSTGYMSRVLTERGNTVIGVEIDPVAASIAKQHCDRLLNADIESLLLDDALQKHFFDVVILGDVLEHLKWPDKVIEQLKSHLRADGYLVVSLPNVAHGDVILNLLAGQFPYHDSGLLDITHLRFFGLEDVVKLFDSAGYRICNLRTVRVDVGCTEISPDLSEVPQELLLGVRSLPHANSYQFVFRAFRAHECREPLQLENVGLKNSFEAFTTEVRRLRKYLARLQPEFDEKAAWADKLNAELTERVQEVQELRALWAKATRWKRAFVFSFLAPLDWAVGAILVASELVARVLRMISKRPAPLLAPAHPGRCSIVIVTWEGKDLLAESLPALLTAVKFQGGDHEIIVVDNGSTDGTEEYLKDHFPQVQVVRNPFNEYFAGGNNLGVAAATNDILVLLNNDMIVHEDFLAPLLAGFSSPDIFAVASQVFLADPSKRREETGKARASFNGCDLDWRHETVLPSDEGQQYVPVFWGHGGAVAVDRHKFQWLGGLNRLYDPFYVEDADLSYCAWKVGWRCLMAVQSKVIHKHRSSTSRFGEQFISQIVRRNQYLFLWKNFADFGKLLAHFARSPRALVRRAGTPGIGIRVEMLAFLGAVERLPAVLRQKLRLARSVVRSDQEILEVTNTPPDATIKSNHIDFALGSFSDQLGSGWHDLEVGDGRPYRWMTKQASVFLLAPHGEAELLVQGYVPSLSSYEGSGVSLNVRCCGQQKHFTMKEGGFEYRWLVRDLPARLPVEVELWVNRTLSLGTDQRKLGIALHSVGLVKHPGKRERPHCSISINGARFEEQPNSQQKRVLMVCAYLPCLGTHGGGNMMFNLIRHLSKSHRLTVLSFYEEESELSNVPQLAKYCERLEVLYRGQSFHTSNLFGLKPPEIVREFYHEGMERLVKSYLATQHFDLMQCEYLQTAHFANVEPFIPAVLTNHEVLSLSRINQSGHLSWTARAKLKALVSAMRMLNYEEKILRRFSAVVVLTEAEADFLARYAPSVPLQCHPMGVDCDFFSPGAESSGADNNDPKSVVFVGSFRHSPNATGALWLLEQVWPLVVERYPSAQLYLVGNNPTPAMLKRHGKNNVTVTGWVDDVRPYLERASAVVAPVFEGAGMRTKVLEAWATAKAVVGTPLAFEGLSAKDGEFSFIAADPDTFVQRILELLHDENLAREMGRRARDLAISSFSWEAFAAFYADVYEQVLRSTEYGRSERQSSGIQVTNLPAAEKVERQ
jgi:GT2 family glycosyltransferase/glycosyltransferase involved in cell wall biosynthesis/SAM-dependent methyltransferase